MKTRKEGGKEVANRHHTKQLDIRPTSGDDSSRRGRSACTCGQSMGSTSQSCRLGFRFSKEFVSVILMKFVDLPAWCRCLAGVWFQMSSNFSGSLVTFSSFKISAHSTNCENRGVGGTPMCTNHKWHKGETNSFYFIKFKRRCGLLQINETN